MDNLSSLIADQARPDSSVGLRADGIVTRSASRLIALVPAVPTA
jgi:hypothetical protein